MVGPFLKLRQRSSSLSFFPRPWRAGLGTAAACGQVGAGHVFSLPLASPYVVGRRVGAHCDPQEQHPGH